MTNDVSCVFLLAEFSLQVQMTLMGFSDLCKPFAQKTKINEKKVSVLEKRLHCHIWDSWVTALQMFHPRAWVQIKKKTIAALKSRTGNLLCRSCPWTLFSLFAVLFIGKEAAFSCFISLIYSLLVVPLWRLLYAYLFFPVQTTSILYNTVSYFVFVCHNLSFSSFSFFFTLPKTTFCVFCNQFTVKTHTYTHIQFFCYVLLLFRFLFSRFPKHALFVRFLFSVL